MLQVVQVLQALRCEFYQLLGPILLVVQPQQFVWGDDPAPITSDAVPSAVAAGSSISYQWQSWTYGGSFADIPGATGLNFDPSAISTTTAFRRIAYVSLGGKTCPIAADIETAASNVVTITVNTTALPVISFVSGATNDVMCEGDDLTFDASGTTGANFFQFFVNGISQGPSNTASTLLVTSSMLTDGSTVRVVATSTAASHVLATLRLP